MKQSGKSIRGLRENGGANRTGDVLTVWTTQTKKRAEEKGRRDRENDLFSKNGKGEGWRMKKMTGQKMPEK